MSNQDTPRRDAKLSRRLRTNETERVTLVRKCEVLESKLREGLQLLNLANEEIKRLKKEATP